MVNFYMCWKLKKNEIEKAGTKVTSLCKCLGIICFLNDQQTPSGEWGWGGEEFQGFCLPAGFPLYIYFLILSLCDQHHVVH